MRKPKATTEGLTIVGDDEVDNVMAETDTDEPLEPGGVEDQEGSEEAESEEAEEDTDEPVIDLGLLSDVDDLDVEDLVTVIPLQDREFTCARCFLVTPEANRAAGTDVCRDCD